MDGVFRGLGGLLRGIFRGRSQREIPRSSLASPEKAPSSPTFLLRLTFFFKQVFSSYQNSDKMQSRGFFARPIKATYDATNIFWDNFLLVKFEEYAELQKAIFLSTLTFLEYRFDGKKSKLQQI